MSQRNLSRKMQGDALYAPGHLVCEECRKAKPGKMAYQALGNDLFNAHFPLGFPRFGFRTVEQR